MAGEIGAGFGLDLTSLISAANKADQKIADMVEHSRQLNTELSKAVASFQAMGIVKDLGTELKKLKSQIIDVDINVDTKPLDKVYSTIKNITEHISMLNDADKQVEIIDTKNIYEAKGSVSEVKKEIVEMYDSMINSLNEYNKLQNATFNRTEFEVKPFEYEEFTPVVNPKNGVPYKDSSKTQQAARKEYEERLALAKEAFEKEQALALQAHNAEQDMLQKRFNDLKAARLAELEVNIENRVKEQAILNEKLNWFKLSEDERANYTKKTAEEIFKSEVEAISKARAEYEKIANEQISLSEMAIEVGDIDISADTSQDMIDDILKEYQRLDAERKELEARYGIYIVDIAKNAQSRIGEIERDRRKQSLENESAAVKKRLEEEANGGNRKIDTNNTAIELLNRIKQSMAEIGKMEIGPNFDTESIEAYYARMKQVLGETSQLIEKSGGSAELYDNQALYTTSKSLDEIEAKYIKIKQEIESAKHILTTLKNGGIPEGELFEQFKDKDGNLIESKREEFEEIKKLTIAQTELLLKQDIEKRAIAKKELQWANMTESERVAYVEKGLQKELAAYQKHVAAVQREYSSLAKDTIRIFDQMQRQSKTVEKGEELGVDVSKEKAELDAMNELLKSKYTQLESLQEEHGVILQKQVEEFWAKTNERDRRGLEDRIKIFKEQTSEYLQTPKGALEAANNARTGEQMETAKVAVKQALFKVDKADVKTIQELNDAYIKLRSELEKLTRAQENEKTLQPTIRNEYSRLLKELDKVKKEREALSKTDAFKSSAGLQNPARQAYSDLISREQDLQKRIKEIRENAGDLLAETERKHAADNAAAYLAEVTKAEHARLELVRRRLAEEQAERSKYGAISSDSANRLIGIVSTEAKNKDTGELNVKNVQQAEEAIKRLKQARAQLNQSDENYDSTLKKLNAEIEKHEHNIKMATDATYRKNQAEKEARAQNTTFQGALDYSKNAKSIEEQRKAIEYLKEARDKLDKSSMSKNEYEAKVKQLTEEIQRQQAEIDKLTGKQNKLRDSQDALANVANKLKNRLTALFSIQAITGYVKQVAEVRGEFEMQHKAMQVLIGDVDKANEIWNKTVSLAVKSPFKVKELVTYTKQLSAYRVETDKLYDKTRMLADISAGLGVDMNRLILAYGQVKAANYLRGTELRQFSEAGINLLGELSEYFTNLEGRAVSTGDVFERISKRMVSFEDVDAVLTKVTSEGGAFYQMQEKQSETLRGSIMNLNDSVQLMLNSIGETNEGSIKASISLLRDLVDNWRVIVPIIETAGFAFLAAFSPVMLNKIRKGFVNVGGAMKGAFKALPAAGPWTLAASAIAAIAAAVAIWKNRQNELNAELSKTEKQITDSLGESIVTYRRLVETVNDVTASYDERDKALSALKQKFQDILPDEQLELEYIQNLKGSYEDAEQAMMAYYDAKAQAQKKSVIQQQYDEEIATDQKELEQSMNKLVDWAPGLDDTTKAIAKKAISGAINETIEQIKNGEADIADLQKNIENRVSSYIGVDWESIRSSAVAAGGAFAGVASAKANEQIKDLTNDLIGLKNALEGVTGIKLGDNFMADLQGDALAAENEKVAKAAGVFKKAVSIYNDAVQDIKNGSSETDALKKAGKRVDDLMSEEGEELGKYGIVLRESFKTLEENVKKGSFEFTAELQGIESALYKSQELLTTARENLQQAEGFAAQDIAPAEFSMMIPNFADEILRSYASVRPASEEIGRETAGIIVDNYEEELRKRGEKLDYTPFQKAAIEGFKNIATKHGLDDDIFTKFIPKLGDSRQTIATQLKADYENTKVVIEQFETSLTQDMPHLTEAVIAARQAEIDAMKKQNKAMLDAARFFGEDPEKSKKGGSNSMYDERIKVIDDMNKKYNELRKTLSDTEAKQGAFNAYIDAFATAYKGIKWVPSNVREMSAEEFSTQVLGFANKDEIVTFFDKLSKEPMKAFEKVKVELAKGRYVEEITVEVRAKMQTDVQEQVEKMFGDYEIGLELKEMNIPPDLADKLFGVQALTLPEMKSSVVEQFASVTQYVDDIEHASNEIKNNFTEGADIVQRFSEISSADLQSAGWSGMSDMIQFDSREIGEKTFSFSLTPVLPDGSVMTTEAVNSYISDIIQKANGDATKIKELDTKGVLLSFSETPTDEDMGITKQQEDILRRYAELKRISSEESEQVISEFSKGLGNVDWNLVDNILGTDQSNLLRERLQELSEMENKEQLEALKKYTALANKMLNEKAKLKMEELNTLADIEKTYKPIEEIDIEKKREEGASATEIADYEKQNERIRERNLLLSQQKELAVKAVASESHQKTMELEWDEFRSSDSFLSLFENLDKASDKLIQSAIDRIEEFKEEWKDMPVAAAKDMFGKLGKLQQALIETGNVRKDKNAIETVLDDEIEKRELDGRSSTKKGKESLRTSITDENAKLQEEIALENEKITLLGIVNGLTAKNKQAELEKLGYTTEYIKQLGLTTDILTNNVSANNAIATAAKDNVNNAQKQMMTNSNTLQLITKQEQKAIEIKEQWNECLSAAENLLGTFMDLGGVAEEALGMEFLGENVEIFSEMGSSMLQAVMNAISLQIQLEGVKAGALAAGTAMNTAMGVIGWIVMAVQLLTSALKAIVQIGDKKREKALEAEEKKIESLAKTYEKLQKAFEKIEKAIEDSYTLTQLSVNGRAAEQNLDEQLKNIEEQKKAREEQMRIIEADKNYGKDNKKGDKLAEDYAKYQEELEELEAQEEEVLQKREEIKKELVETLGGSYDYTGMAEEFLDAWLTAFEETGDGMKGLEDSFDDFWKSVLKKQVIYGGASQIMKKYLETINAALEDDSTLSDSEIADIEKQEKETKEKLNEFFEWANSKYDLADVAGNGELSGLAAGISGITEDQADILAGYWNAVRFSVSSIDNKMNTIIDNLNTGGDVNPIINQLRALQSESIAIKEAINSIIYPNVNSANSGSVGIKVYLG